MKVTTQQLAELQTAVHEPAKQAVDELMPVLGEQATKAAREFLSGLTDAPEARDIISGVVEPCLMVSFFQQVEWYAAEQRAGWMTAMAQAIE